MSVETELALIKSDVVNIFELFRKLDVAISKFGDISNNINKLLAVHEERINTQERQSLALERSMLTIETNLDQDIKELHSRMTTTTREISNDLVETEKRITQAIKELKQELNEERSETNKKSKELEVRIQTLERWKWIVMGGSSAVGFLLARLLPAFEIAPK
jgi:ElaB/YqjD/DUF883 family membrane-anchored ribosome-binding protein